MPYGAIKNPEDVAKMESCIAQVQASGKPKQAAIAICYSSIMGKKVLLSPYSVVDRAIGDLIPPEGGDPLSWSQVAERDDDWAQKMLAQREVALQATCLVEGCDNKAMQLITVSGNLLPYCDEHLSGAKDVLARHKLSIGGERSAEQVWVDAKGFFYTDAESGRTVFADGPGAGGGSSGGASGLQTANLLSKDEIQLLAQEIRTWEGAERQAVALGALARAGKGVSNNKVTLQLENGELKGISRITSFAPQSEELHLQNIATKERGFGKTLMTNAVEQAVDRGYSLSWQSAPKAEGFYDALGFSAFKSYVGGIPNYLVPYEALYEWLAKKEDYVALEPDDGVFTIADDDPPILSLDSKATPSLTELATAIADRAGGKATAEDVQRDLLEPWLTSVFGTPASNQMQKVAARTFGFPDPAGTEELKINWQLLYPMGEMYNITQEYLKARGFNEWETVPVYHPYVPSEARPKQWQKGDEVRIKLLPLTSWTLDVRDAAKVAEFMGAPGSPAFVLKTFIPIKSIVSTPNTGIGLPGTQEIVLAGGEYEAILEQRYA